MLNSNQSHFQNVLHHLYINPLEKCNLNCKICYTRKTDPILSKEQILDFVDRYNETVEVKMITFCGGEVFALQYFSSLVNELAEKGIFIQIITNGTIDKLEALNKPNSVNIIVSIDGLEEYHDKNRGEGNFKKSTELIKKAQKLGFHTEIFSILTKQNIKQLGAFQRYIKENLNDIPVTFHPRKPPAYLKLHPISNIEGAIEGFDFLTEEEMNDLYKTTLIGHPDADRDPPIPASVAAKDTANYLTPLTMDPDLRRDDTSSTKSNVFPPPQLGCYQISLVSNGDIYGCCEGTKPIGKIEDSIEDVISALKLRLEAWEKINTIKGRLGCPYPEFMCGIKKYLK